MGRRTDRSAMHVPGVPEFLRLTHPFIGVQTMQVRRRHFTARRWLGMAAIFTLVSFPDPTTTVQADEPYFPAKVFDQEDEQRDSFWAIVYTRCLRTMGEPSLWRLSQVDHSVTAYRLLWLPSFEPGISARITRSGEAVVLHVVMLDGKGGDDPGKVAVKRRRD